MKLTKRFSPAVIQALRPEEEPYRVWDTQVPGLFLRVQPTGIKSFNVQWSRTNSRALGKWPGVTVEAARTRARTLLVETEQHGAPLAVIEARKPESDKPITFDDFIDKHYAPWALQHQKRGQATIDAIRRHFGAFDDKLLQEICAFDIERHKARRLRAGLKPSSVNRELGLLRGALSRAVDWSMLQVHPMRTVKPVKGADNSRVRYLAADEEKRLREALARREQERRGERASGNAWLRERGHPERPMWPADGFTDHLQPVVLLALNTGLRRGELLGLSWEQVDLTHKLVTVTASVAKSGKTRHVPLNAEALDVLMRWHKQNRKANGLVFPGRRGTAMTNISTSWERLVSAAGLTGFRFHDLRHDFASKLVMAGIDLNTVRELLGHADLKMTLRYAHLAPDRLAAAVEKLGAA